MWEMVPTLAALVQGSAFVFTEPTLETFRQVLLGWIMCLGKRTEYHVFQTIQADEEITRQERHPFDRFYNFFSRASWDVLALGHWVAVAVVTALNPQGKLYLLVDDTLLHKRGKHVYGLGWFRDAVASTKKRVATASGNNWVVLGLAVPIPLCPDVIVCLPLLARLHLPGKGQPSCANLAREMLVTVQSWFADRALILVGDGGYAAAGLLKDLPAGVTFVGRLRADAAVYDPKPARASARRRGPKAKKGPRLPSPKQAAQTADRNRNGKGPWCWQQVCVTLYGVERVLHVVSYVAVWPTVLGLRPVRVVVVRDTTGKLQDTYLFTTDLTAELDWVVKTFGWRWSIEVSFKASKQAMGVEGPQHWCQGSVERMAPWVWLMQSVVVLWYLTAGQRSTAAIKEESLMGEWDSPWSLQHMLRVLRRATLDETITADSAERDELVSFVKTLKNVVNTAA
jgi:hypothetical protein